MVYLKPQKKKGKSYFEIGGKAHNLPPIQPNQTNQPPNQVQNLQVAMAQMLQLNWSYFKPEFSGKPEEDAEEHLLRTNDSMETHNFPDDLKFGSIGEQYFHAWRSFQFDENADTIDSCIHKVKQVATLLNYGKPQILETLKKKPCLVDYIT